MTESPSKFENEKLLKINEQALAYARESDEKFLKSKEIAARIDASQARVSRAMYLSEEFEEWTSGNGSINRVFLNPFYNR
jgi:hypothetical protein